MLSKQPQPAPLHPELEAWIHPSRLQTQGASWTPKYKMPLVLQPHSPLNLTPLGGSSRVRLLILS